MNVGPRLDECHRAAAGDALVIGAHGIVVASKDRLDRTRSFLDGDGVSRRRDDVEVVEVRDDILARRGLGCARLVASGRPTPSAVLAAAVIRWQVAVLGDVLSAAVRWLRSRTSDGTPLLDRQLLQGDIADVALELGQASRRGDALTGAPDDRLGRLHEDLVLCGRSLLRLFGAEGFLAAGVGGAVHATEVVGNVYLPSVV